MSGASDSGSLRGKAFLARKVGPVTYLQIIAMVIGIIIGVAILCPTGMARSMLGWLLVAIIVYMLPHLAGLKDVKIKSVYGLSFAVIAILVGSALVGPAYIDENSTTAPGSNSSFSDISYTVSGDTVTVTASFAAKEGEVPVIYYLPISMVAFRSVYITADPTVTAMTVSGSSAATTVNLDSSQLYYLCLSMAKANSDGSYTVDSDTASQAVLSGWDYSGSAMKYTVMGAGFAVLYVMVIFFLILLFSTLMRRKMEDTRKKMETDGRLYPQGYGRCEKCGAVVLPGEVRCRKCGAYIDRPEEMKPEKKDFFQCSECGAEVPADATVCPKCGAKFDGIENEVIHPDGKIDVSTENMTCPQCGEAVPKNADFCPKCGHKFHN